MPRPPVAISRASRSVSTASRTLESAPLFTWIVAPPGPTVGVAVGVGVWVWVGVAVAEPVGEAVGEWVGVDVGVGVWVGDGPSRVIGSPGRG